MERGAIVHLEKNNAYLEVNGVKTEIIFDGARTFIKAKVIAAVGDATDTGVRPMEAEDTGGASGSGVSPGAGSA